MCLSVCVCLCVCLSLCVSVSVSVSVCVRAGASPHPLQSCAGVHPLQQRGGPRLHASAPERIPARRQSGSSQRHLQARRGAFRLNLKAQYVCFCIFKMIKAKLDAAMKEDVHR